MTCPKEVKQKDILSFSCGYNETFHKFLEHKGLRNPRGYPIPVLDDYGVERQKEANIREVD